MIPNHLIAKLRNTFALDWRGIHGAPHWARVRRIGLKLAAHTGADLQVVEHFAFLHDVCRFEDAGDPEHGLRAAWFAAKINNHWLHLSTAQLKLLQQACASHSHGLTEGHVTVLTCWDADRLDLGRIGIEPAPQRLCTATAKQADIIDWAYAMSAVERSRFD